jgi:hypothetical protein
MVYCILNAKSYIIKVPTRSSSTMVALVGIFAVIDGPVTLQAANKLSYRLRDSSRCVKENQMGCIGDYDQL